VRLLFRLRLRRLPSIRFRLYPLPYVFPICPHEAEASSGVLWRWSIFRECLVDESLYILVRCRPRLRILARLCSDQVAEYALFEAPATAVRRVVNAEHVAMLVPQVLRKSRDVPILDIPRVPVFRRR